VDQRTDPGESAVGFERIYWLSVEVLRKVFSRRTPVATEHRISCPLTVFVYMWGLVMLKCAQEGEFRL